MLKYYFWWEIALFAFILPFVIPGFIFWLAVFKGKFEAAKKLTKTFLIGSIPFMCGIFIWDIFDPNMETYLSFGIAYTVLMSAVLTLIAALFIGIARSIYNWRLKKMPIEDEHK